MKTQKIRAEVKVVIELDEKEAEWLHEVMQNPLHGQSPMEEDLTDSEMRLNFFNATAKGE